MSTKPRQAEPPIDDGRQLVQRGTQQAPGGVIKPQKHLQTARIAIVAAKAAYQFKSPRWLILFSRAMEAIEQCAPERQEQLKRDLCRFHPNWNRRPQDAHQRPLLQHAIADETAGYR
jgi:hypothetical protein